MIKGTAGNFGFHEISEIAASIEHKMKARDDKNIGTIYQELVAACIKSGVTCSTPIIVSTGGANSSKEWVVASGFSKTFISMRKVEKLSAKTVSMIEVMQFSKDNERNH